MEYLEKYNISKEQIEEIKDRYNDGIIDFLCEEEEFIIKKIEYLRNKEFSIYPILVNNIKIFLEEIKPLDKKIEKMEAKGYKKEKIQMILNSWQLYDKEGV